jgi:hypothetical protein
MPDAGNGNREFLIDLDAFAPSAGKRFRFQGHDYTVRHFNDIRIDDALRILRAEQEMRGKTSLEQLELGLQYLAILVPEMDRATVGTLTATQMLQLIGQAMGVAEVPPVAGAAPSGSGIPSPSSAASTAGPGPQSGS